MFNGIIKLTGNIKKIKKNKNDCFLQIKTRMSFLKSEIGSSIACSGACLTLEKKSNNTATFYLSRETLSKTIFKHSKKGDVINLEKSMKYGDRLSGHFVQGHVDTICSIKEITVIGKTWLIKFILSPKYKKYITTKGSITINGVSLTISKVTVSGFQIAIIPKTLQLTNLINFKKGDFVNVEFDILGKYIKNFIK